jgi:hypothetical protein
MQHDRYERDGLEDFFAAGRRHTPPPPSAALMTRILADAAEVGATLPPARRGRSLRAPIGGWPAAAALGFCVAIGLSAGLLGGAERGSEALWEAAGTADEPATEILAFYDLAGLED